MQEGQSGLPNWSDGRTLDRTALTLQGTAAKVDLCRYLSQPRSGTQGEFSFLMMFLTFLRMARL